jgi:hypothetical protein
LGPSSRRLLLLRWAFPPPGLCFWTEKEKIVWLERYLEGLQEEVKAVEERITALKEEK